MSIQEKLMNSETQELLKRVYQIEQNKEEKTVAYIDLLGAYAFADNSFLANNDEIGFDAAIVQIRERLDEDNLQRYYEEEIYPFHDKYSYDLNTNEKTKLAYFSDWYKDLYGNRPMGDNNVCYQRYMEKLNEQSISVAIESTDDYDFVNSDVEKFRIVKVGEDGRLTAYEDTIYDTQQQAKAAIENNPLLNEVDYDEIIRAAAVRLYGDNGLDKSMQLIQDYLDREFGDTQPSADFSDLHNVSLAYTTITDNEIPLQVTADLIDRKISYELYCHVYETEQFESLEAMNTFLEYMTFDELTAEPSEEVIKTYEFFESTYAQHKPTVTVEWSEHGAFESGKTYTVSDFSQLISALDKEWILKRNYAIEKYGSAEAAMDAGEYEHLGYAKVKFHLNDIPDNLNSDKLTSLIGRQDIGDGDGTLTNHIRLVAENDLTYINAFNESDRERVKASIDARLNVVVPYLNFVIERENRDRLNEQLAAKEEKVEDTELPHGEEVKEAKIAVTQTLLGDKGYYRSLSRADKRYINTSDIAAIQLSEQLSKSGIKHSGIIDTEKNKGVITLHRNDYATAFEIARKTGINLDKPTKTEVIQQGDKTILPSNKETMIAAFNDKLGKILDSENFKNFCMTKNLYFLNNYSFRNALLIYTQNPNATYVGSAGKWQQYGRIINSGEKAMKIFRPQFEHAENSGKFWSDIKRRAINDLRSYPERGYGEAKVGITGITITAHNGGQLYDISINDNPVTQHQPENVVKRWLEENVLDKVPIAYSVTNVFDVSQTNDSPEYLWLKSGFKKSEMVLGENGKPITNRQGAYKIRNTDERRNRLITKLDMTIPPQDKEKMSKFYDVLVSVSNKNGCPVIEKTATEDERLNSAYGFYSPDVHNITLRADMEITEKCAVLIHEMAHSRMHHDLPKEVRQDQNERREIEIQAEATACMVASRFGIETETSSFNYIATYTAGRKLDYLEKSLSKVWNEAHKLSLSIDNELRERGLTKRLEPLDKPLTQAERNEIIKDRKALIEMVQNDNNKGKADIISTVERVRTQDEKTALIAILSCRDEIDKTIDKIIERTNQLETAEEKSRQDKLIDSIRKGFDKISALKDKITMREQEFKDVEQMDTSQKQFLANPIEFMKNSDAFKGISPETMSIIAQSKFIRDNFSETLNEKNGIVAFARAAISQAKNIESVMSKKYIAVEVVSSENWGNKTQFSAGMCMHPKIADKAFEQAETEIRIAKKSSENKGEYFPYSKTEYTIYSRSKDKGIEALTATMEVGSGNQENLSSALQKICQSGERSRILADFEQSLKEHGEATKVVIKAADINRAEEMEVRTSSEMGLAEWRTESDAARASSAEEAEYANEVEKDELPFDDQFDNK